MSAFAGDPGIADVAAGIDAVEARIRAARAIYLEPDLDRTPAARG